MMSYPGMEERTLIIDGFSKSFAMTGWRLGYTAAPPRIVPALDMLAVNSYTCVAEFTQYAAIEALRDREGATPRMVGEFAKRREQFVRDLNRVPGFRCVPPEGAFYAWVNISEAGQSAEEICRIMLEEAGVAAIPGAAFGPAGADFVRFSFASSSAVCRKPSNGFCSCVSLAGSAGGNVAVRSAAVRRCRGGVSPAAAEGGTPSGQPQSCPERAKGRRRYFLVRC